MKILPVSRLGKWTLGLTLFALVIATLLFIFAEQLDLIPEIIVGVLGSACVIAVVIAFFTGILAIIPARNSPCW